MKYNPTIQTVESVTSGHPDKVCDQISDAILDECLRQDPDSRVAIEAFGGHGLVVVGGEVTTRAEFDPTRIAERVYRDIGYTDDIEIITRVVRQSPDIARGVDAGGAGDQGIMYGFATNETEELLPESLVLAHKLAKGLEDLRRGGEDWILPDGKSQVTFDGEALRTVLISTQHGDINQDEIRARLTEKLIEPLVEDAGSLNIFINPTGKFELGGFAADTGLTGRKLMVDTYGGLAPHGGGCFSGKDSSKVDRSAAYMARFAAKNIVAEGLADKCLVSVAYAIGRDEPLMLEALNEKGENLSSYLRDNFDFRPQAIIERLDLKRPIYQQTASYGHFGRKGLPWEDV